MHLIELRTYIDEQLKAGLWTAAREGVRQLWSEQAGSASAGFIVSRFQRLRERVPLTPCRLTILRSFTVEPVVPLLTAGALVNGIDLTVEVGDFNGYRQEILNPASALYRFSPDVVILAAQLRDIAPELWSGFADGTREIASAAIERVTSEFESSLSAFRSRSNASVVIHDFEQPMAASHGILDAQIVDAQQLSIDQLNREIRRVAASHAGVYVLDYDGLVARHGRMRWYDERKWLMARMPIAANSMIPLAAEWMRFLHPLCGKTCKALVTDLDNTLWGGVLGEDGINGIKIGPEYPGGAYWNLQRVMLDLSRRGVLLAIASKNDETEAWRVIETHPGMLLGPKHFSAQRINWNDKAQSLREIAAELNLGLDALSFLDDNPVERGRIRMELPEVRVIDLPQDPFGYAAALRECPAFERLSLSAEDRDRSALYASQRERAALARETRSIEDFYRSLDQEVEIAPAEEGTLGRIAQLTQKTNQFNLTSRRYTQQQLADMAAQPGVEIYGLRVKDRFGDNGLVGVAITKMEQRACEIDTFLLSCRVIGRTIETALLSFLAARAQTLGAVRLTGFFFPTRKNEPARDLFSKHGFEQVAAEGGRTEWTLDLKQTQVRCPDWIRLLIPQEELFHEHSCS